MFVVQRLQCLGRMLYVVQHASLRHCCAATPVPSNSLCEERQHRVPAVDFEGAAVLHEVWGFAQHSMMASLEQSRSAVCFVLLSSLAQAVRLG